MQAFKYMIKSVGNILISSKFLDSLQLFGWSLGSLLSLSRYGQSEPILQRLLIFPSSFIFWKEQSSGQSSMKIWNHLVVETLKCFQFSQASFLSWLKLIVFLMSIYLFSQTACSRWKLKIQASVNPHWIFFSEIITSTSLIVILTFTPVAIFFFQTLFSHLNLFAYFRLELPIKVRYSLNLSLLTLFVFKFEFFILILQPMNLKAIAICDALFRKSFQYWITMAISKKILRLALNLIFMNQ